MVTLEYDTAEGLPKAPNSQGRLSEQNSHT